jgi:hypothetical protein
MLTRYGFRYKDEENGQLDRVGLRELENQLAK